MNKKPLVSVVIPSVDSVLFMENCLRSLRNQQYKQIEIIIAGIGSPKERELAKKYQARLYKYFPNVEKGYFDAPFRRNFGAKKAKGEFIYYVDADMEFTPKVIAEAVSLSKKYPVLIVPEDSFGEGIWARAKNLERRCYWGDDAVEAPRFVKKKVWDEVGGLDALLGGGGDDWDFYQKVLDAGYKVGRVKSMVMHNEGKLKLSYLFRKRFMYGRDAIKYVKKRPGAAMLSYFPIRKSYLKNWRLFASRPVDSLAFVVM